jgi:hypothetical protein
VHVEVERLVERAGGQSLEGCMASSITQAREGTLYLMAGGKPQAYERALPILQAMSKDLKYIGEAGTAAQVKALVNMVMNINTAGLAEGLGLGAALGLDLTMLREVFAQTGANSRVLETDGADMQHRDHECYFSASHAAKDSGIALSLASEQRLTLPLAGVGGLAAGTLGEGIGSLGAMLGMLAVLGLAVRSNLLLVRRFQDLRSNGTARERDLVIQGTREQAMTVVMTALTTTAALLPFALSGSIAGVEILHPMAVVVLGGLVTSTAFTLLILPVLYLKLASGPQASASAAFEPLPGAPAGPTPP